MSPGLLTRPWAVEAEATERVAEAIESEAEAKNYEQPKSNRNPNDALPKCRTELK